MRYWSVWMSGNSNNWSVAVNMPSLEFESLGTCGLFCFFVFWWFFLQGSTETEAKL